MRGYPDFNFAEFDRMEQALRDYGFDPISPANISRAMKADRGAARFEDIDPRDYIDADLRHLRDCDALLLLGGWENSRGAAVEIAYARYCGIPIYQHILQLVEAA